MEKALQNLKASSWKRNFWSVVWRNTEQNEGLSAFQIQGSRTLVFLDGREICKKMHQLQFLHLPNVLMILINIT
ncbi:hypothetical protein AMELA_G00177610 [Ameiurus melas]|uniref:Uncharacterized protein n=1 Tax=Ameiurus melas TaxID=219545 RepID=A0A7J6A9B3_AMEME|nr:hypothetical protein AMELA_G00177610 [Ameiurus melas]